jgi:hypothetical protein
VTTHLTLKPVQCDRPAGRNRRGRNHFRVAAVVAGVLLTVSLSGSAASADQTYHSQHYDLTPVDGAPLHIGFVENIHANGPNVFAHELYVLNGAAPNNSYQVELSIWLSNLTCSGSPTATIHPADLETNASGNGEADHVFTPQNVEDAGLLGRTVSATWLLSTRGSPSYETGCEVVTLD